MSGKTVLIVEDEGIIAVDTKLSLTNLGYDVLPIAISGENAVKLALKHNPDIILMDVKLSGRIDGIEAAEQILKSIKTNIIFMTAHTDNESLSKVNALNPAGILYKLVVSFQWKDILASALKSGD